MIGMRSFRFQPFASTGQSQIAVFRQQRPECIIFPEDDDDMTRTLRQSFPNGFTSKGFIQCSRLQIAAQDLNRLSQLFRRY